MGNRLGARLLLALFDFQTLFLLLEPGGIVPLPGNALAAVKFKNPFGRVIKKIAVMRYGNDGPGEAVQELLKPLHAFSIEVVCRFVKKQHVGLRQKQSAQCHTALFAAREVLDHRVPRGQTQGVRGNFHLCRCVRSSRRNNGFKFGLFGRKRVKVRIGLGVSRIDFFKALLRGHHFAHALFDAGSHSRFGIKLRLLRQIPDL